MRLRALAFPLVLSFLGGCFGQAPSPTDPPLASTQPAPGLNRTSFHLALEGGFPAYAMEFTASFSHPTTCLYQDADSAGPSVGAHVLRIWRGFAGHDSHGTSLADAHAGPVDTRKPGGGSGSGGGGRITLSGDERYVFVMRDVQPGHAGNMLDSTISFALDLECDAPFTLHDAWEGRQVLLADQGNLAGGAGAQAGFFAAGGVADGASLEVEAPHARAAAGGTFASAAVVSLQHPSGSELWNFTAIPTPDRFSHFKRLEDGPGTYAFTVNHASGPLGSVWVAAWGLDFPLDLTAGEWPASAIHF